MFYLYLLSMLKIWAIFIFASICPLMVYMPRLLFVFKGLGWAVMTVMWFLAGWFRQYLG